MVRIELPGRVVEVEPWGEFGADLALHTAPAGFDVRCDACEARNTLVGPLEFESDWNDDLKVHEVYLRTDVTTTCAGCGARLRGGVQAAVYTDRATGRSWAKVFTPSCKGGTPA